MECLWHCTGPPTGAFERLERTDLFITVQAKFVHTVYPGTLPPDTLCCILISYLFFLLLLSLFFVRSSFFRCGRSESVLLVSTQEQSEQTKITPP